MVEESIELRLIKMEEKLDKIIDIFNKMKADADQLAMELRKQMKTNPSVLEKQLKSRGVI